MHCKKKVRYIKKTFFSFKLKMHDLPNEIILYICTFLDIRTLCRMSTVNYRFMNLVYNGLSWKNLFKEHFGAIIPKCDKNFYEQHFIVISLRSFVEIHFSYLKETLTIKDYAVPLRKNNRFKRLTKSIPQKFSQLRKLTIHSGIKTVFDTFSHLRELSISSCHVNDPKILFSSKLRKLVVLRVTGISWHKIELSTSLKKLRIAESHLTFPPKNMSLLTKLENLEFTHGKLKDCSFIVNLVKLKTLFLGENKIKYIPKYISSLRSLTTLDFHRNKITFLPEEIFGLSKLMIVYLYENKIKMRKIYENFNFSFILSEKFCIETIQRPIFREIMSMSL